MTSHTYTVTTARGMLPLLADELRRLGISNTKQEVSSIRFRGSLEDAYRVCLWSRVAIRVLMPIAHFAAETPEQLYDGCKAIAWEDHIDAQDSTLAVDFNSFRSKIKHSQYGAQKVKDAIVDRFREQTGQRPSVELFQPDLRINVYVKHNQAIVSIDLSGESLHKRGYRHQQTEAPLKEHLAAAILLSAEWLRLSRQGWGLLDPMCGSGTFLIEAAMIAADIAPAIGRDYFGFLYWKQHDQLAWQRLKAEAERRRHAGLGRLPMIVGGDSDAAAVTAAEHNIEQAGLQGRIEVFERALLDWPASASQLPAAGLLVCNPPYGERIGQRDDLHYLYDSIGNIIQESLPGWRSAIITDTPDLGKFTGLTLFDRIPFDNGPIACEVLYYRAVKPVTLTELSQTATEKTSTTDLAPANDTPTQVEISEQGRMFANRLGKNFKHLSKWARKNSISCYRVYDADLPDFAAAIDIYAEHVHVQEYAPPKKIDPLKATQRLAEMMQIIPQVLAVPVAQVHLKVRQRQSGKQQYEAQAAMRQRFAVDENGLKFWVNMTDYLDAGLFLDHRLTRQMLAEQCRAKDFLNLFAYTGSATVYAAAAGAASTTSVDMSNTYLNWAQDNLLLNKLEGPQHRFIRANCLDWLSQAREQQQRYDVIFLDPPTFSNSSRMEGVFDIQRDHVELIWACIKIMRPGGLLFFSTNRRDFKLDKQALDALTVDDISRATLPVDFEKNPKIHYCWKISKHNKH